LVAVVLFPLILGTACTDEDIKPRLVGPGNTGTIEGRILTVGGVGWRGWVQAETAGGSWDQRVFVRARADSTGAYTLLVPFGLYFLSAEAEGGVRLFYGAAGLTVRQGDALRIGVGRTVLHADFPLGGAEVTLDTPGVPEHSSLECSFFRPGQTRFENMGRVSARVSDGRVVFVDRGLLAGRYGLRVRTSWREEFIVGDSSLPGSEGSVPADDATVTIGTGRMTQAHLALSPPAVLSGKVDGAWRDLENLGISLLAGRPDILVHGRDSTSYSARSAVGLDGSFRFYLFRPDSVRLALEFGYGLQWLGGTTFREATMYLLAPGRETEVPAFTDAAIVLRVTAPEPLATFEATVTAWDARQRPLFGSQRGVQSSGNLYCLAGLAPGTVYLQAGPQEQNGRDPWLPAWYPGVTSFDQAVPVTLRAGEVVELETPLIRGGVIQGRVTPAPGDDPWVWLGLYSAADTTRSFCSAHLSDGEWTFRYVGLQDGAFLLRAQFRGYSHYRWKWYAGAVWARDADTLRVSDHGTIEIVDWR
jgi:hypothetical protein